MEIKKSSWHYRFLKFAGNLLGKSIPNTSCAYFNDLLGNLVMVIGLVTVTIWGLIVLNPLVVVIVYAAILGFFLIYIPLVLLLTIFLSEGLFAAAEIIGEKIGEWAKTKNICKTIIFVDK